MSYTALVLTPESQTKLIKYFELKIPSNWKTFCHHMTINMGNPEHGPAVNLIGQEFEVLVNSSASNDQVIAVGVESDAPSTNTHKHITVAINVLNGGKPKQSNDLKEWIPLPEPFTLRGIVQVQ